MYALLAEKYPVATSRELAALFPGKSLPAIRSKAKVMGLKRANPRFYFTKAKEDELRALYPNTSTAEIAARFGCKINSVHNAAMRLGFKKDSAFLSRVFAERMADPNHPGRAHQFQKGTIPANKGKKWADFMSPEAQANSTRTQFKKGQKGWNYKPVGYERVSKDGYIEVKIAEPRTFRPKHRVVWEKVHGPIPRGHKIAFRDGDKRNFELSNLEMVSNSDFLERNTVHRFPEDVRMLIHAKGALNREINKYLKNNES